MVTSMEEARQNLAGHLAEHCRPGSHPQAKCCLPVADAYAKAVARRLACPCGLENCPQDASAVLAEIDALGTGAGDCPPEEKAPDGCRG